MLNHLFSRRVFPLFIAPVSITVLLTACGDDGSDIQEPAPQPAAVASITISAPTTTIQVGQTVQLAATAMDSAGTTLEGRTFEWITADPAVASVSPAGLVTGLAGGQVEVSASSEGITGSIALTITVPPPPPPPPPSVTPGLQPIASGLDFPVYLTSPPGDDRLFVLEKAGVIRLIKGGVVLEAPFLDITEKVLSDGGEQGLLGLAFFPDYAVSGRFLIHYTDASGTSQISLFRVSADPDRADPASEAVVLSVTRPGGAHNGGQLLFGPDGYLYIGLGDGDDNDGGRGQSLSDLLASILRLDVSTGNGYTVPADNPFVATSGARAEVWSYGLRNPWRFSFDRATGDLYIGDVGESEWEEVNYASAASGAGRGVNYGWSLMEASHCMRSSGCEDLGLTLPIVEYSHSEGCSVTGGYVYRGSALPAIQGRYFYADYCGGWVHSLRMEGGIPVEQTDWPALQPDGFITSFGEDSAGELYLVTREGGIYKIVPK